MYYEYILVYVNDIMLILENCAPIMEKIGKLYWLKEDSVGLPLPTYNLQGI